MNGTEAEDGSMPSEREQLEADADAVRHRLARRLDELHARREALFDPREEAKRHPGGALVAAVTLGVVLCTGVAVAGYRHATRQERIRRARWDAWRRLLTHPEDIAPPRRSALLIIAEKATTAAVGAGIAALVKRYTTSALSE